MRAVDVGFIFPLANRTRHRTPNDIHRVDRGKLEQFHRQTLERGRLGRVQDHIVVTLVRCRDRVVLADIVHGHIRGHTRDGHLVGVHLGHTNRLTSNAVLIEQLDHFGRVFTEHQRPARCRVECRARLGDDLLVCGLLGVGVGTHDSEAHRCTHCLGLLRVVKDRTLAGRTERCARLGRTLIRLELRTPLVADATEGHTALARLMNRLHEGRHLLPMLLGDLAERLVRLGHLFVGVGFLGLFVLAVH